MLRCFRKIDSTSRPKTTPWAIKRSQHVLVCNFVKNQRFLMQFSLVDLQMNDTCVSMNFTYIT